MEQKRKILIIEDDAYLRELYEEVLKEDGFDVDTAEDGGQGIIKAREGGYKLILLDLMMPKVNGMDFLNEFKKNQPKVPNGPVVLLTNLTNDPALNEAIGLGAKSFIIKSDVNPGEFKQKVEEFIKNEEIN